MNTDRFSEAIGTIRDALGKMECLVTTPQKRNSPPPKPLPTHERMSAAVNDRVAAQSPSLNTAEEVLAAINERIAMQCSPNLWEQAQESLGTQHQREERRTWRQIVAAVRANDEAEAARLAKAAGIPTEYLKS